VPIQVTIVSAPVNVGKHLTYCHFRTYNESNQADNCPAMLIKKPSDIASSEITPKSLYVNRRQFMAGATAFGAALAAGAYELASPSETAHAEATKLQTTKSQYSTTEQATPQKDITTYNNFYEFSTDKHGPS